MEDTKSNISEQKLEIVQMVLSEHDEALLAQVHALLAPELWEGMSQGERDEIEEAIADLDAGLGITEAEAYKQDEKAIRDWRK